MAGQGWERYRKEFSNYLTLERSLSKNSSEAYIHDVTLVQQYLEISKLSISPSAITTKHLQGFLQYINELGMSAHSQARILSGIKGFFKYLMAEEIIDKDPTTLIEGPRLGRKLPDTLSYEEIVQLLEAIDLSTPEGGRNRAMLEILYSSGLRVSELVELKRANVYFDLGFLKLYPVVLPILRQFWLGQILIINGLDRGLCSMVAPLLFIKQPKN